MKAIEFPFEELLKAADCLEAFTFYQCVGDKNRIYWQMPIVSGYELDKIKEIVKEICFLIYPENDNIEICFIID